MLFVTAVGFELHGSEFMQVTSMTQPQIASRSYIQLVDLSARFTSTARVSGDMDIANIGTIGVNKGIVSFGLGIGIVERTGKIYFNEISSILQVLKSSAEWRTVGVLDAAIPVVATIEFAGDLGLTLNPLISITSSDLFTPELPSMSIDLNLE